MDIEQLCKILPTIGIQYLTQLFNVVLLKGYIEQLCMILYSNSGQFFEDFATDGIASW
jgi:hypothetical protein